ncbi:MAG TPA: cation:proton antiporter [Vicinamibacterales bacterium]|jgi:Kef-type K+ transport system membrane component KefB
MTRNGGGSKLAAGGTYAAIWLTAAALFFVIRGFGEELQVPGGAPVGAPVGVVESGPNALLHILLALAGVVALGRLLARVCRLFGQPAVIGEVIAGILLGPSLLGRLAPGVADYILPPFVAPTLGIVSQIGVVLYMFMVGLDLDLDAVRKRAHSTVLISHSSIVTPFVLGSVLALWLFPRVATPGVPFTSFALFMGIATSITAFPVLARILTDRGITRTELGRIALTCAAVDDVTAWCLLAFVVGVAQDSLRSAAIVGLLTAVFVAVMFLAVRPLVARLMARIGGAVGRDAIALVLLGVLVSSLTTEAIGIHAIFGAFLLGAIIPSDSTLARTLVAKFEDLVTILLLPAFFAFTGMRTRISLVATVEDWIMVALIILVATAGKFGGTVAAARATGMAWRQAAGLGALMNTRGLMELIVLNIGLDLQVISPTLFTMMVLMALITTIATTPVLNALGTVSMRQADLSRSVRL